MKQLLFIILNAFIFSSLFSQVLVTENKLWSNISWGSENPEYYIPYYIKFSGDTLIGDKNYKNVLRSDDSLKISWKVIGQIREDATGKVFWTDGNNSCEEQLLYDFSLEQGDSILTYSEEYAHVDSVRFRYLGASEEPLKFIYLQHYYVWIEGVGSQDGILNGLQYIFLTGEGGKLICYSENDQLIYHDEDFSSCFPANSSGIGEHNSDEPENGFIAVSQINSFIRFTFQELQTDASIIRIYDLDGKEIEILPVNGQEQIDMPAGQYPPGLYIFLFDNGIVRINGKFVVVIGG